MPEPAPWNPQGDNLPPSFLNTGEGEVPLAKNPEPRIDMRTLASDAASVSASGGSPIPGSYTPATQNQPDRGFAQVRPESEAVWRPPEELKPVPPKAPLSPSPKRKRVFVLIVTVLVLLALGAGGYFAYPYANEFVTTFFGGDETAGEQESEPFQEPNIPVVEQVNPQEDTEVPAPQEEQSSQPQGKVSHVSLFKKSVASEAVTLSRLGITEIQALLSATAPIEEKAIKEIVFRDSENTFISFQNFVKTLWSDVFTENLLSSFNADYTLFTYRDRDGVWPGFVVRLAASDTATVSNFNAEFEKASPNILQTFYPSSPGTGSVWKQGKTGTIQNRYLVYTNGAFTVSLNYAWINGTTLVVGASYDSFKAALNNL